VLGVLEAREAAAVDEPRRIRRRAAAERSIPSTAAAGSTD
jgi:hypothetical protein